MTRLILLLLLLAPAALRAQDILVVSPEAFQGSLEEWRAHRERQGHVVAVHPPGDDVPGLVKRVHAKSEGKLRFVLLLGDVRKVACSYVPADVIRQWEKDRRIATDLPAADLDGDGLPDLAIGRVPADNPKEAAAMLGKVLAYEKSTDFGLWRRRVNVIAGVGGFGKLQDFLIEKVATKFLSEGVPPDYDLHVTYANENSAFCPPPAKVAEVTVERFNEGALIVAYTGHGNRQRLDRLHFGGRSYDIFTEDSVYELEARHGAPIAYFCACSTGYMDGAPDSLAEVALKEQGGPVAVFAASRVSIPYANGVFSKELLDAIFKLRVATVGEMLMHAHRRMMVPEKGDETRRLIDTLARTWKWKDEDQEAERREHLFLYNLFGDPSMRIARTARATLECASETKAGARLAIRGESPVAGTALVELVADPTPDVAPRAGDTPAAFEKCYVRSNARVRAHAEVLVGAGAFEIELAVPKDLVPGGYSVRVYVSGASGAAMGARTLKVAETR